MSFTERADMVARLSLDDQYSGKVDKTIGKTRALDSQIGKTSTRTIAHGVAIGSFIDRALAGGISKLFGGIRAGEQSLEQLEAVGLRTNAVLKSTGGVSGQTADSVRKLAEQYENLSTNDDKAIQNTENLLLTFTGIHKEAFEPALQSVLDLNAALGGGDEGLQGTAIQVGKALNDPIKGITALRRVGVSFTADQEKQIKALIKGNDLYGAQKIILGELNKEFGGQAGAFGTGRAADVRRLQDATEDFQRTLAEGLTPAIDAGRRGLTELLKDPAVLEGVKELGAGISSLFSPENVQTGLGFLRGGLSALKDIPWGVIETAMTTTGRAAKIIFDTFTGLPDWVKTAVLTGWGLNKLTGGALGSITVDVLKGGLGRFLDRGSPINPMFVTVTNPGLGGPGGPGTPGVPGGTKGGLSVLGKLSLIGEAIGLITAVNEVRDSIAGDLTKQTGDIHDAVSNQINDQKTTSGQLAQSLAGVNQGIEALSHDPIGNALLGDQLGQLEKMRAELGSALKAQDDTTKANFRQGERDDKAKADTQAQKLEAAKAATEQARDKIEASRIDLSTKLGETRGAVQIGSSNIVDAIDRIKLDPKIIVNVPWSDKGDPGSRPGSQPKAIPYQEKGDVGLRSGTTAAAVATLAASALTSLSSLPGSTFKWTPSSQNQIEDRRGEGKDWLRDFLRSIGIGATSGKHGEAGKIIGPEVLRDGFNESMLPLRSAVGQAIEAISSGARTTATRIDASSDSIRSGLRALNPSVHVTAISKVSITDVIDRHVTHTSYSGSQISGVFGPGHGL